MQLVSRPNFGGSALAVPPSSSCCCQSPAPRRHPGCTTNSQLLLLVPGAMPRCHPCLAGPPLCRQKPPANQYIDAWRWVLHSASLHVVPLSICLHGVGTIGQAHMISIIIITFGTTVRVRSADRRGSRGVWMEWVHDAAPGQRWGGPGACRTLCTAQSTIPTACWAHQFGKHAIGAHLRALLCSHCTHQPTCHRLCHISWVFQG